MATPKQGRYISKEWLENILSQYEAKSNPGASVQVTSFQINPGSKPGEQFSGDVVKVFVEALLTNDQHPTQPYTTSDNLTQQTTTHDNPTQQSTTHDNPTQQTTTHDNPTQQTTTPDNPTQQATTHDNPTQQTTTPDSPPQQTITPDNPTQQATTSDNPTQQSTTHDNPTQPTTITYNLFAKFLGGPAFEQQMARLAQHNMRELLLYSEIIPKLNDFQAQHGGDNYRIETPEFVYGICNEDDYVLVMKDVTVKGYGNEDKYLGLDLPHVMMAVDRIAKLHAVSIGVFKSKDNFANTYPIFYNEYSILPAFYKGIMTSIYDSIVKALEKKKEKYERILTKLKSNKENIVKNFRSCLIWDSEVMCLNHGDLWTNNLMYINGDDGTNGESGKPLDVKFVDWEVTSYRNPAFDLSYFIYTSTTDNMRKNHLEEILRHYHDTFTAATTHMGIKVENWEFEDFMAEWKRVKCFGIFLGLMVIFFAFSESGKDLKKETPDLSSFSYRFGTYMGKKLGKRSIKTFNSEKNQFFLKYVFKKLMAKPAAELASWKNDHLQSVVLQLVTEADESGILDG